MPVISTMFGKLFPSGTSNLKRFVLVSLELIVVSRFLLLILFINREALHIFA